MKGFISIVVPVFNRPEELGELLTSLSGQTTRNPFEVVVVEDGSERDSASVVQSFQDGMDLKYFRKANTGPGDSRNYGMQKATGSFFVLVDSDCILPPDYLEILYGHLETGYADCVGGRDTAHDSFNAFQKAVNFCMTSPLTTGGLRGGKGHNENFQPRSFNMGLSAEAFRTSGGFGNIHPGEDPDLSLRLRKQGYTIRYLPDLVVYHKRRIDLRSFFRQVFRFGMARPILNRWHPGSGRLSYWLPSLFSMGIFLAILLPFFGLGLLGFLPLIGLVAYLLLIGTSALIQTGKPYVALLAVIAIPVQFLGYGLGFLKSQTLLTFSSKKPQVLFPDLFFNR